MTTRVVNLLIASLCIPALCACGQLYVDDSFLSQIRDATTPNEPSTGEPSSPAASAKILFFNGVPGYGSDGGNEVWSSTNRGQSWSTESTFPYGADHGFGSAVLNGKIFVAGGADHDYSTFYSDVAYTTDGVTWNAVASLPAARALGSLVAHGSHLYWIAGIDTGGTNMDTIYRSVDEGANWTTCAATLPVALKLGTAVSVDGSIFWMGGETASYHNLVLKSGTDPCTDAWSFNTALPSNLGRFAATVMDGRIYVAGGYNSSVDQANVYVGTITTGTLSWTTHSNVLPSASGLGGGYAHDAALIVHEGKLLLIGGYNYSGATTDIYESETGATWTAVSGAALPTARGSGKAAVVAP